MCLLATLKTNTMTVKEQKDQVRNHLSKANFQDAIIRLDIMGADVRKARKDLKKLNTLAKKVKQERRHFTDLEATAFNGGHQLLTKQLLDLNNSL